MGSEEETIKRSPTKVGQQDYYIRFVSQHFVVFFYFSNRCYDCVFPVCWKHTVQIVHILVIPSICVMFALIIK
jgi:hypothetical protein